MKLFTRISRLSLFLLSFSIHMQCMENKRQPRALARLAAITSHIKQGIELDEKDFPDKQGNFMLWKQELRKLEDAEQFEEAIELMEKVIKEDLDDVERYIFLCCIFLQTLLWNPTHAWLIKTA